MLKSKIIGDFKQNKMLFISVMLMAFLGVLIYTGIGGEWAGVNNFREGYYRETNLADGWIWGEGFDSDDLTKVKNIKGITEVEKRCYFEATGDDEYSPTVYMYGLDENTISMPYVVEGEDFDSSQTDKVWLDKRFADAKGLKLGDSYTFKFENTPFTLQIAGLVYSSEYQYYANDNDLWPDFNKIGFAFCSYKAVPVKEYVIDYIKSSDKSVSELVDEFAGESEEIAKNKKLIERFSKASIIKMLEQSDESEFEEMIPFTQIIFKSSVDASTLSDAIDDTLKDGYAVFTTRNETAGIKMMDSEMEQHKMIGSMFPVIFMLIAILAIITSMNRLVNTQRVQIGTLKALGFSKGKIALHYMNYGFWPSLTGSVLGLIVGPLTIPHLFYSSMKSYYTLPQWKSGWDISFFTVTALTVLACTLTTFLTVASMLKESPAATLRPKPPKNFKLTKIEKSRAWSKLNFNFRWSLRSFTRGKIRTVMGIIGTIGCMALLVCAFSMYDCMDDLEKWQYNEIQVAETRLTLDSSAKTKDAEKIADEVDGELIMSDAVEIRANGEKRTTNITVTDGSGCYYLSDLKRNQITPDDNTIALTKKMCDALGIGVGDEFEWHIYASDKWVKSKVTLINRSPMTQGISITRATLEAYGYDFTPTYVDTMKTLTDYENDFVATALSKEDMHMFWDNYMESMNMIVVVLLLFAIILAVVVLYNLGQINFTENERVNATMRVIGFQNKKILGYNIIQNIIFSVFGIIFGVPLGLGIIYAMLGSAGDEFDMMVSMSVQSFLISAAITLGVSVLTSLLFSKALKRLDMVSSLKGVE